MKFYIDRVEMNGSDSGTIAVADFFFPESNKKFKAVFGSENPFLLPGKKTYNFEIVDTFSDGFLYCLIEDQYCFVIDMNRMK